MRNFAVLGLKIMAAGGWRLAAGGWRLAAGGLVLAALSACDGGYSSTTAPPDNSAPPAASNPIVIQGVAATGQPVVGATISAQCVSGSAQATSSAQGAYTLNLPADAAFPCVLQAQTVAPATALSLQALALQAGTANLTPLTTLQWAIAGANASRADGVAAWLASHGSAGAYTSTAAVAAWAQVKARLLTIGLDAAATTTLNALAAPVTVVFVAASPDAHDHLLDQLALRLAANGLSLDTLLAQLINGGQLNDTGVTASQCYQAGSDVLLSCTSAAAIALNPAQDGMVGRDASPASNGAADGKLGFTYTKISASGQPLAASATSWACVKDNLTGLVWEVKTNDGGLRDSAKTYTNVDSTATDQLGTGTNPTQAQIDAASNSVGFKNAVNAATLCGASDWRLPTAKELESLVDYGMAYPGPTIDAAWFPNTVSAWSWSSSPDIVVFPHYAWYVNFYFGAVVSDLRESPLSVRLVRAGK